MSGQVVRQQPFGVLGNIVDGPRQKGREAIRQTRKGNFRKDGTFLDDGGLPDGGDGSLLLGNFGVNIGDSGKGDEDV